jgi:hypothetical protein
MVVTPKSFNIIVYEGAIIRVMKVMKVMRVMRVMKVCDYLILAIKF